MLASLIAERYAKALLRGATAEKALVEVGAQAETLRHALASVEGAGPFLSDPVAEPQAKLEVLTGVFDGTAHPVLQAFLLAVLEQKRERFLPAILNAFSQMRDEAEGRATVSYGTAQPLASGERALIEAELSKRLGREVTLQPYTDQSLLGGAVLRVGDTVYDGSLRNRLTRLGRLLSEGPPPRPNRPSPLSARDGAVSKSEVKNPVPRSGKVKPVSVEKKGSVPAKKKVTKVKIKAAAPKKKAAAKKKTKAAKKSRS
jgi:F-type H+-transporting ATPase subunit delta